MRRFTLLRAGPLAAALTAAIAAAAGARAQDAADVLYAERAKASALNVRCGLFDDGAALAIAGGQILTRNALLRAGWTLGDLARLDAYAAGEAEALDCASPGASEIAGRVVGAYQAWRRLPAMTFAGDHRTWSATRTIGGDYAAWLVRQNVAEGADARALFGLARDEEGRVRLALALPAGAPVRAAHLHMRDFALSRGPVSAEYRRFTTTDTSHPLAAVAPPDAFTTNVWGSGRQTVAAGEPLAEGFDAGAILIWYPVEAGATLAALDPRESAYLELELAPRGEPERRERLYVEIGDFAVARLFIALADQSSDDFLSLSANPAAFTR